MRFNSSVVSVLLAFSIAACGDRAASPTGPAALAPQAPVSSAAPWGPESPNFNLEAILRGDGFGLVKFRQPNDDQKIVYLDVSVRGLAPNTAYVLQRAVDTNLDGNCTGAGWLTLGKGLVPQTITTDASGTGREELWRSVSAIAIGATFDIHFRVIDAATSAVALTSGCYQYTVTQ